MQKLVPVVWISMFLALAGCGGGTNSLDVSTQNGSGQTDQTPGQPSQPIPTGDNTVTISWTPPSTRVDGSVLNDLAGYEILYGTDRNALLSRVTINNPGATAHDITGLGSGTFYFVVRGFNTAGVKSPYSNTASVTI